MMLVRNTLWSRRFFRQAAKLFDNPHMVEDVRILSLHARARLISALACAHLAAAVSAAAAARLRVSDGAC